MANVIGSTIIITIIWNNALAPILDGVSIEAERTKERERERENELLLENNE